MYYSINVLEERVGKLYLQGDLRICPVSLTMSIRTPVEIFEETLKNGDSKAELTFVARLGLSFLAGAYIAFGGFLAIRVGGGLPVEVWGTLSTLLFAIVFPIGLMLTLICGADLFTGNCMTMTASCGYGRIGAYQTLKAWIFSCSGNLVGAVFVAYFVAYQSGLIFGREGMWAEYTVNLANAKCEMSFGEAFWRGVGCNWLVCLAIYAATAAKDVMGKIVALWIPITAFVTLGLEHCVANMFFVPLGLITGGSERYLSMLESSQCTATLTATWQSFMIDNLIPVILGNIVGAAVLVAGIYGVIYRKKITNCPEE